MAKNNNLTDFLTGVANAIRTKKGTTALINPQNFESEIASIESGGAELNVAYSQTAPTDTSKLWIKANKPASIDFSQNPEQQVQGLTTLSATLAEATSHLSCAAVGTKIYLFGGAYKNTIQEFDTETKTITTLSATLAAATINIACAAVGTKIYLFGGYGTKNLIQEFDTETKTITTLSVTLPYNIEKACCAAVGTKIYLFGGYGGSGSGVVLSAIQEFDTETKTITTLSVTLPVALDSIACAAVGTKIYLCGGSNNKSSSTNKIYEFDTLTKTFTASANLYTSVYGACCSAVGTKIYIFGGYSGSRTNTIQEFDTETKAQAISLSQKLPQAMYYSCCEAVGTEIYLFGGESSANLNAIIEFIVNFPLEENDILIQEDYLNNMFDVLTEPTKISVGVKNVYKGNSSNVAEFVDAYLHNGTNWVNVNTGETA